MTLPPAPVLPTDTGQFGPGVLKLGPTATLVDYSCYVNQAGITVSANTTDQTTKLCGAVRAGVTTFQFQLDMDIDLDLANDAGLFSLTWADPGVVMDFEFIPNNDLETKITGQVVTQPLPIDKVEYGADLVASVQWDIVGTPTITYGGGVVLFEGQQQAPVQQEQELEPAV